MYAIVESNTVTKIINNPKALTIGDVQYPSKIFSLWSEAELKAIGIYEVVFDNSNKKDEAYYINTNQSFNYADGQVTASYGTATPKELADILWTQEDSDNGDLPDDKEVGDVKVEGLKTQHKRVIKNQASGLLEPTDWYNHKALDDDTYVIPANIKTYRANVRTRSNEMETAIDNASDVDALATLYAYVNTGTEENPVMERPLGEFPTLEI
tara:strand:- start:288 stop:920 length:633 start_codon:yes stop_codon:yes gene_type:complete